jgi:hypothetical protein
VGGLQCTTVHQACPGSSRARSSGTSHPPYVGSGVSSPTILACVVGFWGRLAYRDAFCRLVSLGRHGPSETAVHRSVFWRGGLPSELPGLGTCRPRGLVLGFALAGYFWRPFRGDWAVMAPRMGSELFGKRDHHAWSSYFLFWDQL